MVIVYESKTGFTKKYADMLSVKTGFKAFHTKEISNIDPEEEIIFLGWINAGRIKGLSKVRKYNVKAICPSGTGRSMESNGETMSKMNHIHDIPLFYLRGGCLPLNELKGMNKILMSMFVKMLKSRKDKNEDMEEAITNIQNGFNGVKEENLKPLLEWLKTNK